MLRQEQLYLMRVRTACYLAQMGQLAHGEVQDAGEVVAPEIEASYDAARLILNGSSHGSAPAARGALARSPIKRGSGVAGGSFVLTARAAAPRGLAAVAEHWIIFRAAYDSIPPVDARVAFSPVVPVVPARAACLVEKAHQRAHMLGWRKRGRRRRGRRR